MELDSVSDISSKTTLPKVVNGCESDLMKVVMVNVSDDMFDYIYDLPVVDTIDGGDDDDDDELNSDVELSNFDSKGTVDSPLLGSIVWAKMTNYPFWPAFITRSPSGIYIKNEIPDRQFHVQFFNWCRMSGWVKKIAMWIPVEKVLKNIENFSKTSKEFKCWVPGTKNMYTKWLMAAKEAESTTTLTRKERYKKFIAHYDDCSPKKRSQKSSDNVAAKKKCNTDVIETMPSSNVLETTVSKERNFYHPNIPSTWTVLPALHKVVTSDGTMLESFKDAYNYVFARNSIKRLGRQRSISCGNILNDTRSEGWLLPALNTARYGTPRLMYNLNWLNLDGNISYLTDISLPNKWHIVRIKSLAEFLESPSKSFESRIAAENYLASGGRHPSLDLEHIMKYTVTPAYDVPSRLSNVHFRVEIERLPDIFHCHPDVIVKENGKELIIVDRISHEYLAKKILL